MEAPSRRLVTAAQLRELHPWLNDATMRSWRKRRVGPPFIKAGDKIVLYDLAEFEAWLAAGRRETAPRVTT